MARTKTEGKREKFVRLAEKRTSNALKAIRLIGNLSNKTHYDYKDADVKKIVTALGREMDDLRRRFEDSGVKGNFEFKL